MISVTVGDAFTHSNSIDCHDVNHHTVGTIPCGCPLWIFCGCLCNMCTKRQLRAQGSAPILFLFVNYIGWHKTPPLRGLIILMWTRQGGYEKIKKRGLINQ